ncbi:MAG: SUF system Fe-S cluster assembly protein [bacterium]|nr:SUF system Fe-S cluster assembly protein [bacterium]
MNDQTTDVKDTDETIKILSIAQGGTPVAGSKLSKEELNDLRRKIVAAVKTVQDPEIPVDIYELGLIYVIDVTDDKKVRIDMTLTAPGCPVAGEMPGWVHDAVSAIPEVTGVGVNMVFDPPWDPNQMSDEARLELGMF